MESNLVVLQECATNAEVDATEPRQLLSIDDPLRFYKLVAR
jgi:hypothetical protein